MSDTKAVVFVTAMSQVEDEQEGLALGAVDYITKPYDFDAAIEVLNRLPRQI